MISHGNRAPTPDNRARPRWPGPGYARGVSRRHRTSQALQRLALGCFVVCTPAWLVPVHAAQAQSESLHQYIPDLTPDEVSLQVAAASTHGTALVNGGHVVRAPDLTHPAAPQPALQAAPGDSAGMEEVGRRSPRFAPDRVTSLEGTVPYYDVFTPSIAPFKRVTALDAVVLALDGVTPVLTVAQPRIRNLAVEGEQSEPPDRRPRDRFWGDVLVDFTEGARVPLPSISPESRILVLRSAPKLDLGVARDAADNFFLISRAGPLEGQVRVTYLMDSPRMYFASEIPRVPANALAKELPPLPDSIRERGLRLARALNLTPESDLRTAITALTAHFRSFEESRTPPPNTGDVLIDLVQGKKGICRHRAYGFVVIAQSLGIVARFVQNEAHAWVEVKLPGMGFMRVDLGGSPHGLEPRGSEDKPRYQPAQPDTLPRPAAFEAAYAAAARAVKRTQATGGAGGAEGVAGSNQSYAGRWVKPSNTLSGAAVANGKQPIHVVLDHGGESIHRGASMHLHGEVLDGDGSGVASMGVEVSLGLPERADQLYLGATTTDESGVFDAELLVPQDLPVGEYQLFVVAVGNETYAPGMAR
jgi:transglutaminase-like putative cysteine protease